MSDKKQKMNREEWLTLAVAAVAEVLRGRGLDVPRRAKLRVSPGWPVQNKGRCDVDGQVFDSGWSPDGTIQIFVSPTIGDGDRAAGTLAHELAHVAIGIGKGHGS